MNLPKIRFDEENEKDIRLEKLRKRGTITAIVNKALCDRYNDIPATKLMGMMDEMDTVYRMRCTNTGQTSQNIIDLLHCKATKTVSFGVRPDELNNRCLVALFEFDDYIILCDKIMNNHARSNRVGEIQDIMKALDESPLRNQAMMFMDVLPDTRKLTKANAYKIFKGNAFKVFVLKELLIMLTTHPSGKYSFDENEIYKYLSGGKAKLRIFKNKNEYHTVYEERFIDELEAERALDKMSIGQTEMKKDEGLTAEIIVCDQLYLVKNYLELTISV